MLTESDVIVRERRRVRCSALPLMWNCPESQRAAPDEVALNESCEAAEAGNAFHRWMAAHIAGTPLDQAALATEHGCDADELRMLCAMGLKALAALRSHFDSADTELPEVRLEADLGRWLTIVGTGDLVARAGRVGIVLDWKTGRLDSEYTHQTRGYAYSALELLGDLDEVVVITAWVRQGQWDVERLSAAQIRDWAAELERRIRNGTGTFNPGAHCQYCPRRAECPGRLALVRSSIADLTVEGVPAIAWTAETRAELGPRIGEMYGRAKLIEGACEDFRRTLRADVEEHGPLPIGGGRQLSLVPVNRRELDAGKARPVLARFLSDEEIDRATSISAGGADSAVAAKAGKGGGAAAKRELAKALEEAGAVSFHTIHQLREGKQLP